MAYNENTDIRFNDYAYFPGTTRWTDMPYIEEYEAPSVPMINGVSAYSYIDAVERVMHEEGAESDRRLLEGYVDPLPTHSLTVELQEDIKMGKIDAHWRLCPSCGCVKDRNNAFRHGQHICMQCQVEKALSKKWGIRPTTREGVLAKMRWQAQEAREAKKQKQWNEEHIFDYMDDIA